jgi:hypothetical protein
MVYTIKIDQIKNPSKYGAPTGAKEDNTNPPKNNGDTNY